MGGSSPSPASARDRPAPWADSARRPLQDGDHHEDQSTVHQEDDRFGAVAPVQTQGAEPQSEGQAQDQDEGPPRMTEEIGEAMMDVVPPHVIDPLLKAAHPPRHD